MVIVHGGHNQTAGVVKINCKKPVHANVATFCVHVIVKCENFIYAKRNITGMKMYNDENFCILDSPLLMNSFSVVLANFIIFWIKDVNS